MAVMYPLIFSNRESKRVFAFGKVVMYPLIFSNRESKRVFAFGKVWAIV
jgi:hypothetical protein